MGTMMKCSWQPENKSGLWLSLLSVVVELTIANTYEVGVNLRDHIVYLLAEFECLLSIFQSGERAAHREMLMH